MPPDVRHRLRPSPERLEAQMMSYRHSQDHIVKTLLDELKEQRISVQNYQVDKLYQSQVT